MTLFVLLTIFVVDRFGPLVGFIGDLWDPDVGDRIRTWFWERTQDIIGFGAMVYREEVRGY